MKKKVLLATDFSENSWNAMQYAVDLYHNKECVFYVLNVFDMGAYDIETTLAETYQPFYDSQAKNSEEGLDEFLLRIKTSHLYSNHEFKAVSKFNGLIEAMGELIEENDIELAVLGTKGATNSIDVIFGGNAAVVMERIRNCPVLVVPQDAPNKAPGEIVFPTSFDTHYKRRELQYIIEIAMIADASIAVLHVVENNEELTEKREKNKKLLEEIFEDINVSFHTVHSKDVRSAVGIFIESRGSDMVTFINSKHALFGIGINKPLVKKLGYHSRVPILALHDLRN